MIRCRIVNTPPYGTAREQPLRAQPVARDLWLLSGRPKHMINVYVMGSILVDSATRHATDRILRQVADLPLTGLALTHGHMDHMGAAHEICSTLHLPLLCGRADVPAVESGGRLGLESRPLPVRIQHRLIAGDGHPVSETLGEGDQLAGFSVLETPGHSPGHVAFWREEDRVLVLGDVVYGMRLPSFRPGLQLPPSAFTPDPHQNLRSARRLAALEPAVICFGHGPPLYDGERFCDFVAGATVRPA
jgi:hydroxyacylglutathione hydrolase